MTKHNPNENNEEQPSRPQKPLPKLSKKKLDRFLSSICEAGGMTGSSFSPSGKTPAPSSKGRRLECQGPCGRADWRSHLDLREGILCVSAAWSRNPDVERHRDVTIGLTYLDHNKKAHYSEMSFCDSEVRWLMETLWHAPIWE